MFLIKGHRLIRGVPESSPAKRGTVVTPSVWRSFLGSGMKNALRGAKARVAGAALACCCCCAALATDQVSVAALTVAVGEVVHVRGKLSVTRANGTMLVLSQKSTVYPGDLLSTQKNSYAQINFTDGSSLTVYPYTQLKVESYNYVQDKPQEDSAFFRLIKGQLRTVTGLVGKRGNQDAYRIGTATATIGIRGSIGHAFHCVGSAGCAGVAQGKGKLPLGTHLQSDTGNFVMIVGDKSVLIREGTTGYSNGSTVTLNAGKISDGQVNLHLPIDELNAGCK